MADTSRKVQDEDRLAEMGYRQELNRDWSMLHNFGVSFSIIVSSLFCLWLFISMELGKERLSRCDSFCRPWSAFSSTRH